MKKNCLLPPTLYVSDNFVMPDELKIMPGAMMYVAKHPQPLWYRRAVRNRKKRIIKKLMARSFHYDAETDFYLIPARKDGVRIRPISHIELVEAGERQPFTETSMSEEIVFIDPSGFYLPAPKTSPIKIYDPTAS